ncbi:MAG: NAD(P)-dependent glycerol-3-phosphate dehydrogenase [Gemmatimonadales bacterium]|nr:MAG: NAD(P)-dependent glycerol-3-phosphate dehydrogenase [Gemmatimonadales bacterium]
MKAAVVGAGSWGTALALLLHGRGIETMLWSHDQEIPRTVRESGENPYLPGVSIPDGLEVTDTLSRAVAGAELVLSVSPSQFVGDVMARAAPSLREDALVISASKGIEMKTLRRMDEVLSSVLPASVMEHFCVLSGPSFAAEVALGVPTAVVVASHSRDARIRAQEAFSTERFRVYTSPDVVGVELGGAVKNVIALAAGVVAGLGFGYNTQAALLTRGLAEITRLGVALGAEPETFSGLAGMGDLVLTCTGELSRNRSVGVRLGQGESLRQILADMRAVAEGVRTTAGVHALAERHGVEMPIVQQVNELLEGRTTPEEAVQTLMMRGPKPEQWK